MTPAAVPSARPGRRGSALVLAWVALAVVYVVWGSTYLAIRVGVRDLPPAVLAGVRYLTAGAILFPIALRTREPAATQPVATAQPPAAQPQPAAAQLQPEAARPYMATAQLHPATTHPATTHPAGNPPAPPARRWPAWREWASCALVGLLLLAGGNGLVTVAERSLTSSLAAVLVATVPLWMVVFAALIERQRVTWAAAAGLVTGLVGVVILVGGGSGHLAVIALVLVAAASWGLGSVLGHRLRLPRRALLAAAMEMLAGGIILIVAALATGEAGQTHWSRVPLSGWLALGWLVLPGSILAFTAYGYALGRLPLPTVSTYAYVNPLVAVALGVLLLHERLTLREAAGALLVVASVAVTLYRRRRDRPPAPPGGKTGGQPEPEPQPAPVGDQVG